MLNILKVGDTIAFTQNQVSCVVIGKPTGEKRCWSNGDNKLIVDFIKSENDFDELVIFLSQAFGYRFKKTKCLYGRPTYKVVGTKG